MILTRGQAAAVHGAGGDLRTPPVVGHETHAPRLGCSPAEFLCRLCGRRGTGLNEPDPRHPNRRRVHTRCVDVTTERQKAALTRA